MGSEMCIRDRPRIIQLLTRQLLIPRAHVKSEFVSIRGSSDPHADGANLPRVGMPPIEGIVGADDALHQSMAHHVSGTEEGEADTLHVA